MFKKYLKSLLWVVSIQWRTSKFYFGWNIFLNIFQGLRPLLTSYAVAQLIYAVSQIALQQSENLEPVYIWLTVLLAVETVNNTIYTPDYVFRLKYISKMQMLINEMLITKVYSLNQEQFEDQAFTSKLDKSRESIHFLKASVEKIMAGLAALMGLIVALIAIMVVTPWVGLLICLSVVPIAFANARSLLAYDVAATKAMPDARLADRSSHILLDPKQMAEIRLINAFRNALRSWRKHRTRRDEIMNAGIRRHAFLSTFVQIIHPLVNFGANIHFFRLLMAGSLRLDSFIFLRGMTESTILTTAAFTEAGSQLHHLSISLQNFNDIYKAKPVISDGDKLVKVPLRIKFEHVSFAYPKTKKLILKDISFEINPGNKLALVGENGAGKTTILKLLMRQYLPTKGKITINGIDIKDVRLADYYALIGNLSQEFWLLHHLTIRENLLVGLNNEPKQTDIWKAIDLAGATTFIKALPKGLEMRLDSSFDNGINLSAGQGQRLSIARTLLHGGNLIILDEPTSAIDAKAEYEIFNNIYRVNTDKTTLIISHRFNTVRQADKIIVLKDGRIVEAGSHQVLLGKNGLYKEMFEIQAEGYQ